jgi:hypothetical protein
MSPITGACFQKVKPSFAAPGYVRVPGNRGLLMLRRDRGDGPTIGDHGDGRS